MNISTKIVRIVSALVLLSVGIWAIVGVAAPAAETVTHERAIRSAAYSSVHEAGVPSGSSFEVEPVSVNLADVKFEPIDSMYDKHLRGELDAEMEGRVGPVEAQALRDEAMNMGPQSGAQSWDAANQPSLDTPVSLPVSFDSLDVSDCCGGGTSVPPDSDMAAGPNHLISVVNSSFAIYNKGGGLLVGPVLFDNFTGVSDTFDPTVLYDEEEDRFVMNIEDGATNILMVSATSDPTGLWYIYPFNALFYGDEFFDYPHIGIGNDAIFMGANMFGGSVPLGFEGRVWAMDKDAAYAGGTLTVVTQSAGYDGSTPQPLNLSGYNYDIMLIGPNHYFISDYYDGTTAWLWEWVDPFGTNTFSVVQTYDLNTLTGITAGYPVDVPQKGGNDIQGNDWRFRGFEYRNGYGYTTDTISTDYGSGTVNIVRVTQIDLIVAGYPAISTATGYTDLHVIFPDLAVDACGNLAVGIEVSGASMYPSIEVTGNDLASYSIAMDFPARLKTGETTYDAFDVPTYYDAHRWGDYSGMAIDPDGSTFWYMGEYSKKIPANPNAANWGNYVSSLSHGCGWIFEARASRGTTALDYAHGWRVSDHPRMFGDVDGDGDDDAVGFGLDGIYVALSNGDGTFQSSATKWTSALDYSHGWRVSDHPRMLADVDGDGDDDAVGFGLDGIYVALSDGSSFAANATKWTSALDYSHGWRVSDHPRMFADVDGDGDADAVGFGVDGIYVALSDGSSFAANATKWTSAFDYNHGWRVSDHPRMFADVDGDGDDDAVGFGLDGIYVALSDGSSFAANATRWTTAFDYTHGWRVSDHPRMFADVDGDGRADAVGFGLDGIYVALSDGSSFETNPTRGTIAFDYAHGWRVSQHPRMFADVNGDGMADAAGFGLDGVYVAQAQ